jgi:mannose-6-phosphate isomerase-like protein (cupin superfamily)
MKKTAVFSLARHPVHLGLGATASFEASYTGDMAWYQQYSERHTADGREGRLVGLHEFTEPWATWEMHPLGAELVVCLKGELTLHQEIDGEVQSATLKAGEALINPAGVWHTADVAAPATLLFITAGLGTQVKPR